MTDNFDFKKFLAENRLGAYSKASKLNEGFDSRDAEELKYMMTHPDDLPYDEYIEDEPAKVGGRGMMIAQKLKDNYRMDAAAIKQYLEDEENLEQGVADDIVNQLFNNSVKNR